MIEKLIASPYLYPLWRVGWLERGFFHACRLFKGVRQSAFLDFNFGFDISKWQGVVDFLKMLAFGARFLILRCGYGIKIDERFEEYIAAAFGVLPLSVYHFYDPVFSPLEQARKVIAILEPHKHKIKRVWLDLEFWWDGAYKDPKHWKLCRDTIKAAGYKTGIYTRATWWDSRVGSYAAEFAKDPVWAAQYNAILNLIPKGWLRATVWQKDTPAIGFEAGVGSHEIDRNLWNDELDFLSEWGVITPPPPPDPEPAPIEPQPELQLWNAMVIVGNKMTIRVYPVTTDATRTGLYATGGEKFSGRLWGGNGYVWMKIDQSARAEIVGKWVAVRSENGALKFITLTKAGVAPVAIEPADGIPLPAGTIHVVLHDHEANDGKQRYGVPEVYPLHLSRYCELTEAWQWFWFRQLVHSFTGFMHWDETKLTKAELDWLKGKWAGITKSTEAFTNFKGTDQCADFVRGVNLSADLPGQEPLTCCGNITNVLSGPHRLAGKILMKIETLDGSQPPPPIETINRLTAPHIILCATNVSKTIFPDGTRKIDLFPHLVPRDVLFPLRTNGKEAETYTRDGVSYAANYIVAGRLKAIPEGTKSVPRPYYP